MPLRIVNTLNPPFARMLEDALRAAVGSAAGELQAWITPAMDEFHAEVVVTEGCERRAAYFASLVVSFDEHVEALQRALRASAAAAANQKP